MRQHITSHDPEKEAIVMAHISVTINSRQYRMACDDGQEQHLAQLAVDFDRRITQLRANFGEIGDMRLTVMAALIIADELSEARRRILATEQELAALRQTRATTADLAEEAQADLAALVDSAAERIERAARLIGQTGERHPIALG
jgi:cell division protein ZapA